MADETKILDLRPKQGSILYELLRLGLVFDHSDDGTSQTWWNYATSLRADFTGIDATTVTFTDTDTRLTLDVTVGELAGYDRIVTWKSGAQGDWPEWIQPSGATDAYAKGSQVTHNGKHWTSTVDANVWEPGVANWNPAD